MKSVCAAAFSLVSVSFLSAQPSFTQLLHTSLHYPSFNLLLRKDHIPFKNALLCYISVISTKKYLHSNPYS